MLDKEMKLFLCHMSNFVYHDRLEIENTYSERPYLKENNFIYQLTEPPEFYKSDKDCELIVTKTRGYRIISFRGTSSKEDVLTDLNIYQTSFEELGSHDETVPCVHAGFYNQFNSISDFLMLKFMGYKENEKIIFTGHSLGGALATIASCFTKSYFNSFQVNCVTFGSPRVGDELFAEYFKSNINESYRFVNDNDPVPSLPTMWRFKHVHGCRWINEDKILKEIGPWRTWRILKNLVLSVTGYGYNPANDHSCEHYLKDLYVLL